MLSISRFSPLTPALSQREREYLVSQREREYLVSQRERGGGEGNLVVAPKS